MLTGAAHGQNIELKSGQVIETGGVRRSGDTIMGKITVGQSNGEIGYPIASIARIAFPEPKGLPAARALLAQGQAERALAELEPIMKAQAPFQAIVGSWWAAAALLKSRALARLHRDQEADSLARQVRSLALDPETQRAADLRLAAGEIRQQHFDQAASACDAAIQNSTEPSILAAAWKLKGDVLSGRKQWDDALMAYLRVPVFYRDETESLPGALLGSARAYRRLEDKERARRTVEDLEGAFPQSSEAAIAKKEFPK